MLRYTIEDIQKSFQAEGYTLLSDKYVDDRTSKLDYICPNGHRHSISWHHWNISKNRCPYCSKNIKPTIEFIAKEFEKEGYKLLSTEYKNNRQDLNYICPNGHNYHIRWSNWVSGRRCPCFSGRPPITIEFIREQFKKENYELLSDEYINAHTKLKYKCSNGHTSEITWSNFKNGYRCMQCFSIRSVSKSEYSLVLFLSSLVPIRQSDRILIPPYELDIVIPSKKIAIEYCGLYWHSELLGKSKSYHLNKLNRCSSQGYRLITIFEDEWLNKPEIVKARLLTILNLHRINTIYARKCFIREISAQEAKIFCEQNHIQGYTGSNIKLGAFYKDELVSVMTFAKPSISKGATSDVGGVWELSRFCSKLDYRVIGVASKLLKYFELNYTWKRIFSYADRRWSIGNVYDQLGFILIGITKPNYWYTKGQHRLHRFNLRKKDTDPQSITEWDLRKNEGWNRIWDCGNLKYAKEAYDKINNK